MEYIAENIFMIVLLLYQKHDYVIYSSEKLDH